MKNGYIYCFHNILYGNNIYKLGRAIDISKRLKTYQTYYYHPTEIILTSNILNDYIQAEKFLFYKLQHFRINKKREFFIITDINLIKNEFNNINELFKIK